MNEVLPAPLQPRSDAGWNTKTAKVVGTPAFRTLAVGSVETSLSPDARPTHDPWTDFLKSTGVTTPVESELLHKIELESGVS